MELLGKPRLSDKTPGPPLNQGWANSSPWVCQLFCDPGGGFRQVLLKHSYAYLFTFFYDCFLGTTAELNSCDRGRMACKDSSIYPVASSREGMLTPVPDHPSILQWLSGPHWLTTLSFPPGSLFHHALVLMSPKLTQRERIFFVKKLFHY